VEQRTIIYNDGIVRKFTFASIFWGIVGMAVGVATSLGLLAMLLAMLMTVLGLVLM